MNSEEIEIKFKNGDQITYYRCINVKIELDFISFIAHSKIGTGYEHYIPTENIISLEKWDSRQ